MKELDALAARKAALDAELAALEREREHVREMIDAQRRLPVLPNIHVAAPCPASWDEMTGDRRVRACSHCKQNVFNLSAMSRADAEELIRSKAGDLCAQYYRRADGTILLADCEVGLARRRTNRRFAAGAALLLAGTAAIAMRPGAPKPTVPIGHLSVAESFMPTGTVVHEDAPPPDDDTQIMRGKIRIIHDDPTENTP